MRAVNLLYIGVCMNTISNDRLHEEVVASNLHERSFLDAGKKEIL